ncbi:hypothetical protein HQ585_09580 [candidate division KSB1 bacterium]|nr:hypothetical protein [candidate division KSB1 bacterium]
MKTNHSNLHTMIVLLCLAAVLLHTACKKDSEILAPRILVGKGLLTVLPLSPEDFHLFVNLGHMSQPGHTFPSDHGGFYLTDWLIRVPIFCPADMIITRVDRSEHVNHGYSDYSLILSVNESEFQIVIGHISSIHPYILEKILDWEDAECESYSVATDTFRHCITWTNIPISAGDTLGTAGGNPGQFGLDFGTFDQNVTHVFASDRFDDYLYPHTVSPLDYFTDEINAILIPRCGDSFCGLPTVRTKDPVGGTIAYDVPGTAQGLWFKPGEPLFPETPHLALVYHNVDPDVPQFSVGTSLPGLISGPYTFDISDTGTVNSAFDEVIPDGQIYQYDIRYDCSTTADMRHVFLMQLLDEETLKIERQEVSAGPPWQFTENAVLYER